MPRVLSHVVGSALLTLAVVFVGTVGAAEDTGLAGEPKEAPRLAVDAFLKDLVAGKYDEAYARTTAEYQKAHPKEKWTQGFTKMSQTVDLSKLKLEQMFATEPSSTREALAAGVTALIETGQKNRKLGIGFGVVRREGNWLIRDIDMLPHANAVKNFIDRFKQVEPNAVEVPAGVEDQPRPVPRK